MSGAKSMRRGRARDRRKERDQPDREQEARCTADKAERQAFRQQLPPDAAAAGAEREPDANLPLP